MSKTKTFRVAGNRCHFKCHACQTKRMVVIPGGVRTRSIRCHKCNETTRCIFNRRTAPREQQTGKILLLTSDGREMDVNLFDLSFDGVGFELSVKDMMKVHEGKDVQLKCGWNPSLLSQGRYVVRSVKGQRVGVERQK